MNTPSLGMLLQAQACTTEECLQALERRAASQGRCAEQDLQLVRTFFHDVSTQFAASIMARLAPQPVVIGNGQHDKVAAILHTYRWKDGYDIRAVSHPYHGVWQPFAAWCAANELQAALACQRDAKGTEKWFTLTVTPAAHLAP